MSSRSGRLLVIVWVLFAAALTAAHWSSVGPATALVSVGEPKIIQRALSHLLGLVQLGVLLLVLLGAGSGIEKLLACGKESGERFVLRLMSGFGVVSLTCHGLGLSGLLHPPVIFAPLAVFGAGAAARILRTRPWRTWNLAVSPPAFLIGLLIFSAFLLSRLPDTHWDPAVYHFAAPEHYLLLGKINAEPQHVYWHNPLGAEMIFLPAWAFGGITCAKLVNVAFLLAGTLALILLTRRICPDSSAGPWAAVWYLGAGLVLDLTWQGKNDIAAASYVTAAAWCACRCTGRGAAWLAAAAWFLGLGMGVKYTAWLPAAGLAAAFIWSGRASLRASVLFAAGLLCLIPLSGWLAAGFLFLGNPFHPFLSSIFPDIGWNEFLNESYFAFDNAQRSRESLSAFDMAGGGIWRTFGLPIHGSLGLFALLPAAFLFPRGRCAAFLKFAALAACLLWLPTHRNPRYLFAAYPLVASLGACAVAGLRRREQAFAAGIAAVTIAAGLLQGFPRLAGRSGGLYLAGAITRESFLRARLTTWEDFRRWVNGNLPASAVLDLSGEEKRIGFRPRVRSYSCVVEPTFWRLTRDSRSTEEVAKKIRQLGITHLAHNVITGEFRSLFYFPGPEWTRRQLELYRETARAHFKPVYLPEKADCLNGGFYVFEFTRRPNAAGFPLYLLPFTEGHFREAWNMHNAGRFPEALREARAAAAPMLDTFQAQLVLGSIHYRSGDYEKARELLQPGVDAGFVSAWDGWNLSLYGTAAINLGHYDAGIAAMEKAYAVTGESAHLNAIGMALIGRGQEKEEKGDIGRALEDFRRAIALLADPDLKARMQRKVLYLSAGR